ncbi:MAG: hypothetical protein ACRCZF_05970 [Gemmataceae bacterium]
MTQIPMPVPTAAALQRPVRKPGSSSDPTLVELPAMDDTQTVVVQSLRSLDSGWEAELLGVLSELEQMLGGLTRQAVQEWPPEAVRLGLKLIQTVADFAEAHFRDDGQVRKHLETARQEAARTIRSAEQVLADLGPESTFRRLFKARRLTNEQMESCHWVLRTLPGALERYLLVLGCGYSTGPAAAKWVETCGVFLTQVKRVLLAIEQTSPSGSMKPAV